MPHSFRLPALALAALGTFAIAACSSDSTGNNSLPLFRANALVADISGQGATTVDANLKNPWGIAINPANGNIWVANNLTGTSTVYSSTGAMVNLVVTIPSPTAPAGGAPTGIAYNGSTGFAITGFGPATYLFAGEDGIITAWNQAAGLTAKVVVNRTSSNASYLGLTIAGTSLFAANFKNHVVDVFDQNFVFVKSISDPGVPSDYGPFNVQTIGSSVYVAYAKVNAATGDEVKGDGNGYVSVFSSDGTFLRRFASQGKLNAPWAIAAAPASFGSFAGAILIGNFGDGRINVYSSTDGSFIGQLKSSNSDELELDGLWALTVASDGTLFYAAGVQDETHGVFGTVVKQ